VGPGRAVRIPARRPAPALDGASARAPDAESSLPDAPFAPNRSGTMRAHRLFVFFVGATLLLLLFLIALVLTSPSSGVRNDPLDYGLFAAISLVLIVASYALALLPAPRGVARASGALLVTERTGKVRRMRADPASLRPVVLRRYPPGPLNDAPVVLVEVAASNGSRRAYLVDEGLIGPSTPPGATGRSPP